MYSLYEIMCLPLQGIVSDSRRTVSSWRRVEYMWTQLKAWRVLFGWDVVLLEDADSERVESRQ